MELIGRIERTLAIRIPDQDLWSLETCGDLAESVARQLEARDG